MLFSHIFVFAHIYVYILQIIDVNCQAFLLILLMLCVDEHMGRCKKILHFLQEAYQLPKDTGDRTQIRLASAVNFLVCCPAVICYFYP